ncbi:MAG: hypothetical protein FJX77_07925 [Armatimonadetes bacterium]|nr:hypothetical protein [Armatimonadota bacterium]
MAWSADHSTDCEEVRGQGLLRRLQSLPEPDRYLVQAWAMMIVRVAQSRILSEAHRGVTTDLPLLWVALADTLIPLGMPEAEAFEAIQAVTDQEFEEIRDGLRRLRVWLAADTRRALIPLGWVLPVERDGDQYWLVFCWDEFLVPRRVVTEAEVLRRGQSDGQFGEESPGALGNGGTKLGKRIWQRLLAALGRDSGGRIVAARKHRKLLL